MKAMDPADFNAVPPKSVYKRRHPFAIIRELPINCAKKDYVLNEIERAITARESGHFICITNPETMYHGLRIPNFGEYIRRCDFSLCDGVGVTLAALAWGRIVPRHTGPILQLDCSERGVSKGWRHFFYGGKDGVADEMARRLTEKYPGLNVCGTYCPPFREHTPEEDEHVVELINAAKPDIIWVGLGLLTQELWISKHLGRLNASWMIGVGAAFDYHSGAIPWAPAPLRAIGLEWVFRLIIEPRLRFKRYWWSGIYVAQTFISGLWNGEFIRGQSEITAVPHGRKN